jgi:soluble lytic murein transglycosylase-like protein
MPRAALVRRSVVRRARRQFLLTAGGLLVVGVILWAVLGLRDGPPLPRLPAAGQAQIPAGQKLFAYDPNRAGELIARATAGEAHPLYVKTPGGAVATAARVARFRALIDRATAGTGIDPHLLEGIVYLESAGQPNVIAGGDPAGAAGLTQIVATTAQSLLGLKVDLKTSRRLTGDIDLALSTGRVARAKTLERARARIDVRFDPATELAATVRYLHMAERSFGRLDLAVESYHMGIGNLRSVLTAYDGGAAVPYVQLYFDSAPNHHAAAYGLLSSFGDDSWTYLWRVLAAEHIMRLYRSDPAALRHQAELQVASGSAAQVLHPASETPTYAGPEDVDRAYARGQLVRLPFNPSRLGLAYAPEMGNVARRFGFAPELYRGLRPAALDLLSWLGVQVRALSGTAPLTVVSTASDRRYQALFGYSDPPAAAGWSFTISRHYVSGHQAAALQAVLDRLQALNLIAWERYPVEIEVTVAADAGRVLAHGV